ncbi:MAG TPA: hypothetical protein VN608_01595 [Clostridia bacterium]|jgi:hypothetical protein|nr:hypothetical protein [Clostridia bacterium]
MHEQPFVNLPVVDFDSGAGSGTPLNRETRYKPYTEKIHANREDKNHGSSSNA